MKKRKTKEPELRQFEVHMRVTQTWSVVVEAVDATDAVLKAEGMDIVDHTVTGTVDWAVEGRATEIDA